MMFFFTSATQSLFIKESGFYLEWNSQIQLQKTSHSFETDSIMLHLDTFSRIVKTQESMYSIESKLRKEIGDLANSELRKSLLS